MLFQKRIANVVQPPLETHTTILFQHFVFPEFYLAEQETGQTHPPKPPAGYMD